MAITKSKAPAKKKTTAAGKKAKVKKLSQTELKKFKGGQKIPTGHHARK